MSTDPISRIEYLARALKAPRIKDVAQRLSERAREESWTYEEYLDAVLSVEVSQREASGTQLRIRAAGFPMRKSIEDFNFEHQPSLPHSTMAHLGMGSYLATGSNVVLLGPPGVGNYVEL